MKCPNCGFDSDINIDKCRRCEEPFDSDEELQAEMDEINALFDDQYGEDRDV